MIRIVEESLVDKFESNAELIQAHWHEIAKNKSLMVLKPNIEQYIALERENVMFALFIYDDDMPVGYSVNFISTHLHYSDLAYALNDVLFIRESHRKGSTGLRLIDETERVAKEKGAQLMLWHAKTESTLDKLLTRRKGYAIQDIVHSKEL